jgi:hypothetical protein
LAAVWRRAGLAIPLLLTRYEFERSLDVFPLEYGDIIAHHVVVDGRDPFAGVAVADADLRRACEMQAKSHLIHLREGFLESNGDNPSVARLLSASGPAFRTLLANLERLDAGAAERVGIGPELVAEVTAAAQNTIVDAGELLARYMAAVERLCQVVDTWRRK